MAHNSHHSSAPRNSAISNAWVLPLDGEYWGAVGEREMIHLVESPTLLEVPKTPFYCRHVLLWNEIALPAFDLAAWVRGRPVERHLCLAGLMVYRDAEAKLGYGALLLAGLPKRKPVRDDQACDLPAAPLGWQRVALSCFAEGETIFPIINVSRVFSGVLMGTAAEVGNLKHLG